ncbi:MAG: hypothetical protein L0271_25710 [Gemmatimonadetes bacterium]|nr:hypothetical protein [Gemmatimonadota bacterium]
MRTRFLLLAALATVVHLAACEGAESVAPMNEDGPAFSAGGASPVIEVEVPIADIAGQGLSGTVKLTRTSQGLWADVEVDGLVAGLAYSVWWAIFNNPQQCIDGCDSFDLRNIIQAQGSLVNGGGFVGTGSTITHTAHLARHDPAGYSVEAGDPRGIRNPYGAEVHIVIRNHGAAEADPGDLAQQVGTFGMFCNLAIPGGCRNEGASVFAKPGAPGQQGS